MDILSYLYEVQRIANIFFLLFNFDLESYLMTVFNVLCQFYKKMRGSSFVLTILHLLLILYLEMIEYKNLF